MPVRKQTLIIASLVALPIGILSFSSLRQTAAALSDPCMQWATGKKQPSGAATIRSGSLGGALVGPGAEPQSPAAARYPCSDRTSGTSTTRREAIVQAAAVPGGLLLASAVGIIGAAISSPILLLLAGGLLIIESLFTSIGPLTFLGGGLLLISAYRSYRERKKWTQRSRRGRVLALRKMVSSAQTSSTAWFVRR